MAQEKYLGREVIAKIIFDEKGTFESVNAAMGWCCVHGYSFGSMSNPYPIAIVKGEYTLPEKWKNFDTEDKASVDGVIVSDNFREGPTTIYIFK